LTDDNAPLTATLKAGAGFDAPWLVVRANNPAELAQRLNAVIDGTVTGPLVAAAQVLASEYSGAAPTPAQQPQQTFQQPPAQNQGFQQQQAPQAAPAAPQGGGQVETDRWGGTYEHGRADAPQTMYGPKVLKRATSQAGKPYAQWLEPRDPKIPSVYQANGKTPPPDLIPAEFARV
jgi:hypothetical protein